MLCIISPPLGKIHPRIKFFITMEGREIFGVEDVAHVVLVAREVDLVSVVVVSCEHLEGSIRSRSKLGLAFLWKMVLVKVYPHEITNIKDHRVLVEVELGCKALNLALDGVPCVFMHLLEMCRSCASVQIDALLEW